MHVEKLQSVYNISIHSSYAYWPIVKVTVDQTLSDRLLVRKTLISSFLS